VTALFSFEMAENKALEFVPQKNISKTKRSKQLHERKPEVILRRIIQNNNPKSKNRRNEYAKRPEVQLRRQELNQKRRALVRSVMFMLQNGMLYTSDGSLLENVNGFLSCPSKKVILKATKKGSFFTLDYENEIDLLTDSKYKHEPVDETDKKLKALVRQFVQGDPDLESKLKKRKVVKEEEDDIDFENMREIIKDKYLEDSDSDAISE